MTTTRVLDLLANDIVIELDGHKIAQIEVPSGYAPYSFMPLIDQHLVVTGDRLFNGMIVLVEDNMYRRNPEVLSPEYPDRARGFRPSDYDRDSIQEQSRWAVVYDLDKSGEIIKFTAIYADGTMRSRSYNKSIKWAVLKEFRMISEDQLNEKCDICGQVHSPKEELSIDDTTKNVTSELLGEELSFDEFTERVKKDPSVIGDLFGGLLDKLSEKFFGPIFDSSEAEIPADRPRHPDETDDEYADRLRDEDEVNGEYDASEKAKIKQRQKDEADLAALREKLSRPYSASSALDEHLANGGER